MSEIQQQRYRPLERLASGGMAEVFIGESASIENFKKNVAIKRVLPHLAEKKRFINMFLDEARLCAQLSHSNVVQVFDIAKGDGTYFIVMEYVDGADLKAVIEHQKQQGKVLPVEVACLIAIKICEGLSYAHELKNNAGQPLRIVHRDMSPPNVLITKYGEVKIVDFGLAKASSQLEKSEPGIIKGKFSYLAPEAAQGLEVDLRADIFAVGIILWEMLAGRRLFFGDTDFATVKQVQEAHVPPLSKINKDVPVALDRILSRALARDPAMRCGSARDLAKDLTVFLYQLGRPVSAFDIATYVDSVQSERKRKAPERGSVIDSLINDALFEFTSVGTTATTDGSNADAPLSIGDFEQLDRFTDSLTDLVAGRTESSVPEGEIGNLSALEDDDDLPAPSVAPARPAAFPPASAASLARPSTPPTGGIGAAAPSVRSAALAEVAEVAPLEKKGGGAVKAIVAVLVLAALAAGAWFGGLIPQ